MSKLSWVVLSPFILFVGAEFIIRILILANVPAFAGYDFELKNMIRELRQQRQPFTSATTQPIAFFSNRNSGDLKKIQAVIPFTQFEPGSNVVEPDYLLQKKFQTDYHIHFNQNGFRGREYTEEEYSKALKVLVLGTEMSFGEGLEENNTWPALLEKKLSERLQKKVIVLNGGMINGTTMTGIAKLTADGPKIKPDIIILEYARKDFRRSDFISPTDPRFSNNPVFVTTPSEEASDKYWRKFSRLGLFMNSQVVYRLFLTFADYFVPPETESGRPWFKAALEQLIVLSEKYTSKIYFVAHPMAYDPAIYQRILKDHHVTLIETLEVLKKNKLLLPAIDPEWTHQFNGLKHEFGRADQYQGLIGAYINQEQLGPAANNIIANEVTDVLTK